MTSKEVVIRKGEIADLNHLVALNYALFQEDAGQRDPLMNLNWPRAQGKWRGTFFKTDFR
jgi:hypothetical protein